MSTKCCQDSDKRKSRESKAKSALKSGEEAVECRKCGAKAVKLEHVCKPKTIGKDKD